MSEQEDQVIKLVGDFGRAQAVVVVLVLAAGIPAAWQILSIPFFTPTNLEYFCKPRGNYNDTFNYEEWQGIAKELNSELSDCTVMDYTPGVSLKDSGDPCTEWIYDEEKLPGTATQKFDLVCDKTVIITISQMVFMVGVLLGALAGGLLADKMGRQKVAAGGAFFLSVFGIGAAFSTSFVMFTVLRFVVAFMVLVVFTVGYAFAMEIIGGRWTTIIGIGAQLNFALGYFTLPIIAFYLESWQLLQIVISAPVFFLFIIIVFVPESPRWHISRGELEKAEKILRKILWLNKKQWPKGVKLHQVSYKTEEEKNATILDLFRTPNIRKNSLILAFLWFTIAMIYFALSLNSDSFIPGGNAFINALIGGGIEAISYIITIFILLNFGRRIPQSLMLLESGIALLLVMAVPEGVPALIMASLGRAGIAAAFAVIYLYTIELFPTVIRTTGFGSASTFSRFGSIIAPLISRELSKVSPLIPLAIFAAFAIISAFLALFLPETKGKILPDTLEQGEQFSQEDVIFSCFKSTEEPKTGLNLQSL